jgi:hypothetical protein
MLPSSKQISESNKVAVFKDNLPTNGEVIWAFKSMRKVPSMYLTLLYFK